MSKVIYWVAAFVSVVFIGALWWRPPVQPADVAGWVQAFGSIVAVGLAVWLQYEARVEREKQAIKLAIAFAGQILQCADAMQLFMRNNDWTRYFQMRTLLDSWAKTEVPLVDLPAAPLSMVITLRSMAVATISTAPEIHQAINWQHWDTTFGNFAHDCRQIMQAAGLIPPAKQHMP